MAVTARFNLGSMVSVAEAISLGLENNQSVSVHWQTLLGLADVELNATSTPVADAGAADQITLSAGAATLDLTVISRGTELSTLDLTGKKVHAIVVSAPDTNTADVVVTPGASNGYQFGNVADSKLVIPPGGAALAYQPESNPDVSGTAKDIDLASSQADAVVNILIVAG